MTRRIVMVCTGARGGMRAVVEGYRDDGLFERWRVELLEPHREGSAGRRVSLASGALLRFLGLLVTRKVDLVHCHAAMRGSFWRKSVFAMLARWFGVPVVFHLHGSEFKMFVDSQPKWRKSVIQGILSRQSVVLVLSESWRAYVQALAPSAQVEILPNYVRLPDLGQRQTTRQGGVNLLFLGLVGQRKGVFELLEAMSAVLKLHPEVTLTIGGNGELERARKLAADLGISEAVMFAGWVSGEAKLNLLQSADIYVLPSHNEGLPVSLLEAMSWSIPVVSTRVGGIPELVDDGHDGLLVHAGQVSELTNAIVRLVESQEVRERMGRAGREKVAARFSRDVVLPRLEAIYSRLLSEPVAGSVA